MPNHVTTICTVTGSPADLIRFVVDPDGAVVPDVAGRLPGRGMWVSASRRLVSPSRTR